jgi:hypothetical protein
MRTHSAHCGAVCEPLFREAPLNLTLPPLPDHPLDNSFDDIELLGFPVDDPFTLVDDDPARYVAATDIGSHVGQTGHRTRLSYHP